MQNYRFIPSFQNHYTKELLWSPNIRIIGLAHATSWNAGIIPCCTEFSATQSVSLMGFGLVLPQYIWDNKKFTRGCPLLSKKKILLVILVFIVIREGEVHHICYEKCFSPFTRPTGTKQPASVCELSPLSSPFCCTIVFNELQFQCDV